MIELSAPVAESPDVDYRIILDAIGEGFVLLDRGFIIRDVNSAAERLLRRSRNELIGCSQRDAWPDSVDSQIDAAFRTAMMDHVTASMKYKLQKNSAECWLELRAYPVPNGLAVLMRDITQAEQALEVMQTSEDRFRAAIAATGVMWTNDGDGRMTGEQPGWSALTGQKQAEYEGYGWAAAVHPDDAEATVVAWNSAVAERRTFVFEHRVRRHDGIWRTFSIKAVPVITESGEVREWVGVHTDVTERHQFEQALRVKEARVRLATDVVGVGIWTCDLQSEMVTWENERIFKIFGLPNDAAPLTAAALSARFLHPDDLPRFQIALQTTVTGTERFFFQGRIYRADDHQLRWIEFYGEPYELNTSQRGLLGTVLDITERRNGEEALRSTAHELLQTNRRKSEFIVTLAHELRNPLAPIRNGLKLLRMAVDNPQTVARVTSIMERQVGQMVHLIDDLLDIERISRGQIELVRKSVDLNLVAAIAIETSLPLIEAKHHDFHVNMGEGPLMLWADQNRIAQMISNLLNNAAKYTPQSGQIHLSATRDGAMAVITVRDSGIGIPQEALNGIFDMFGQIDDHRPHAQGGLGIGLALVRTLAKLHGGEANAFSGGVGKGSSFVIRLPLASDNDTVDEVH